MSVSVIASSDIFCIEYLTIRHLKMQQLIYKLVKNDKRTLHVQHNLHTTLNIISDNISY